MATYRITLDVTNSRHPEYPAHRVSLIINAPTPAVARQSIQTVYVSADGTRANLTGAVNVGRVGRLADGHHYPEWTIVRTRKVADHRHSYAEVTMSTCKSGCKFERCDGCDDVRVGHRKIYGCSHPSAV